MMKKNYRIIILMISLMIFTVFALAGDSISNQRVPVISDKDKDILIDKGINDISVSELDCNKDYCTFWINKEDIINTQEKIDISEYKCIEELRLCPDQKCEYKTKTEKICGIHYNEKEKRDVDECRDEEVNELVSCEEPKCKETICNNYIKDTTQLIGERNAIVDELLIKLAGNIQRNNIKVGSAEVIKLN